MGPHMVAERRVAEAGEAGDDLRHGAAIGGRLSQHSTVKGASPRAFRARSASTRKPGAERGAWGFARS